MKSKIFLKEIVFNKNRRFGSQTNYYPATLVLDTGEEIKALFTCNQLEEARNRAARNAEDFPDESFWHFLNL
jgi:hypothetical protein